MPRKHDINTADTVTALTRLTVQALRLAGPAGAEARDKACRLAAEAWSLLREDYPEEAERMNGVLHYLTGPRFKD